MQNPLEITFKDVPHSERIEEVIREKFNKINQIGNDIIKCHVVLERLSKHHHKGNPICVRLDVKPAHFSDIVIQEHTGEAEALKASAVRSVFKKAHELIRKQIMKRKVKEPRPDKVGGLEFDIAVEGL